MSTRHRLPLAPERPPRLTRSAAPKAGGTTLRADRVVLGVQGEAALVSAFASALTSCAQGACAVFDAATFVAGLDDLTALRGWLDALPRDAWVLAVGEEACLRLAPTFLVGLGRRHETAVATTDLWLGQSSEVVAGALVEALRSAAPRE